MKILTASFFSLLIGLFIGWYIEHRRAEREGDDAARQFMQSYESKEAEEAARDLRAISVIKSGDTQNGVQLLSGAVAGFYRSYANLVHNEKETTKVLAWIEQFATTNQYLADEITNQTSN